MEAVECSGRHQHDNTPNMNLSYTREILISVKPTACHSKRYWRKQARDILAARSDIHTVEIVRSGRKLDSVNLDKGAEHTQPGIAVIIASTGGKWGKSRRNFWPATGAVRA